MPGTGDPSLTQARVDFDANAAGAGLLSSALDFRLRSETIGADLPVIEDDSIAPFGEEEEGLPSKITPGGNLVLNWMAEDHAKFIAALMGAGTTPAETPGGSGRYLHRIAPSESDVDYSGPLVMEISRDLARPTLYTGGQVVGVTFALTRRGLLNGTVEMLFPRFHFWDDASQETGSSTDPLVRGLYPYALLQEEDEDVADLFVKATVTGSSADFDLLVKIGDATTYDGDAIPITVGNDADGKPIWTTLYHDTANAEHVGQNDELPVQIHWPNLTSVADDDEWRIPRRRPVWSQSLPVKAVFNEISAFVYVDGETKRIRELSLTSRKNRELDEVIGGRFVDDVIEAGNRETFGQLSRRALDRDFTDRLLAAESFQLRVECLSTEVGSSGSRRRMDLVMLNCRPSGRTPSVGGRAQFDEAIPFRAHPSGDGTYPSALTVDIYNSQSSLL